MLQNGATSQLISAFPISNINAVIVAACATLKDNPSFVSSTAEAQSAAPAPGYLSPFSQLYSQPLKSPSVDVWCACKDGLKRIECQAASQTIRVRSLYNIVLCYRSRC